ncbi:MAG: phosphoribosylformylglycinamidine synthase, partial [Caulobacter sp.]|nr:phosphoribosylformylglycinamidine synthase [Caulobacter sp.]
YLVAVADPAPILKAAADAGLPASVVGQAGGNAFASKGLFSIELDKLRAAHEGWLPSFMGAAA